LSAISPRITAPPSMLITKTLPECSVCGCCILASIAGKSGPGLEPSQLTIDHQPLTTSLVIGAWSFVGHWDLVIGHSNELCRPAVASTYVAPHSKL
jgi:hypothetical protein